MLSEPFEQHVAFVRQSMQRGLERLYQRQRDATVRRVEGKRGRQMARRLPDIEVNRVFDEAYWREETYHWSLCWHEMLFLLVALSPHSQAIRLDDPRVKVGIERCARSFAAATARTVATRLAESLVDSLGAPAEDDLANRVALVFQELHGSAAEQARSQVARGRRSAATITTRIVRPNAKR